MKYLQMPIVQLLISALVGSLISAIFFLLGKNRKKLKYKITSTNLITHNMANISGLTITMDGKPIKDLTSTEITFQNTGNQTIEPDDFALSDPLRITTHGKFFNHIENLIVSSSNPSTTFSLAMPSDRVLSLTFDYLKPKQTFSITLLHNGSICVTGTLKSGKVVNKNSFTSSEHPFFDLYESFFFQAAVCVFIAALLTVVINIYS